MEFYSLCYECVVLGFCLLMIRDVLFGDRVWFIVEDWDVFLELGVVVFKVVLVF